MRRRPTPILFAALLMSAGCPHSRDRGSCGNATHCKPGYTCAPWGRCTDRCNSHSDCLAGEQCQPSARVAGDGNRFCAVPCTANDQEACDAKLGHFGSDVDCRSITYPGSDVQGWICADPNNGWGGTGNDPAAAVDESGPG